MAKHLHLKFSILCLIFIGYWPLKFKNKFVSFLYSAYFTFTVTIYVSSILAQLFELYTVIQKKDLERFSFLLGIFFLEFLGLQKLVIFNGKSVNKLMCQVFVTEKSILNSKDAAMKEIYMKYVRQNHFAGKTMISVAMFCSILFSAIPYTIDVLNRPEQLYEIVGNTTVIYKSRPLPLSSWFPFDRYKYYWMSYTYHVLALIFFPPCVVGLNTFFYGLITFVIAQIKMLQKNFMEFDDTEDEITKFEYLKKCILYHRSIIQYASELSDAMKTFLLFDFIGYGLQIAVIGFQAAVSDLSLNLIVTMWYLATMLTQVFLFYWFANEVRLESENISKAIWNSIWYNCDKNNKKVLRIIMVRAQKPLVLSVGPFYYMSTETLMSIIRVAYSYAMLMRQLYSK